MEEEDWTYDDLVRNADRQGIKVSPELFRRARKDDFVQPLREASVEKLAAGLLTTKDHIRDLDFAFWRPTNEAPDPEDEILPQLRAGEAPPTTARSQARPLMGPPRTNRTTRQTGKFSSTYPT